MVWSPKVWNERLQGHLPLKPAVEDPSCLLAPGYEAVSQSFIIFDFVVMSQ